MFQWFSPFFEHQSQTLSRQSSVEVSVCNLSHVTVFFLAANSQQAHFNRLCPDVSFLIPRPVPLISKDPMPCFDFIVFQEEVSHRFLSVERSQVPACSLHSSCTNLSPRQFPPSHFQEEDGRCTVCQLFFGANTSREPCSFLFFICIHLHVVCFSANHKLRFTPLSMAVLRTVDFSMFSGVQQAVHSSYVFTYGDSFFLLCMS